MKLMIDIPKNYYEVLKTLPDDQLGIELAIKYGTPLDDVKAEIEDQKTRRLLQDEDLHWYREGLKDSLEILDRIGKAESEDT